MGFFDWIMDPMHPRGRRSPNLPIPGARGYEGSLGVRRVESSRADPRAVKYYPETDSFHIPSANGGPYDIPARDVMKDYGEGDFWSYREQKIKELAMTGRIKGRDRDRYGNFWPADKQEMRDRERAELRNDHRSRRTSKRSSRQPSRRPTRRRGSRRPFAESYYGSRAGSPPYEVEEPLDPLLALPAPHGSHSRSLSVASCYGSRAGSPISYSVEEPGGRPGSRAASSRRGRSRMSRKDMGYGGLGDIYEDD